MEVIAAEMKEFLKSEAQHLWLIDSRVFPADGLERLEGELLSSDADLLATALRRRDEDPDWHRWASLKSGNEENPLGYGVAALLPLVRLSREAAEAILMGIASGWAGHPEALIPSLVNRAGLKIEDIGGTGSFTPLARIGRWYDERTWHWQGPVEYVPEMLHFPVPIQESSLAAGRFVAGGEDVGTGVSLTPKLLYVSPVGGGAADLLSGVLDCFLKAGADCWLLQYDEAVFTVPEGVRVIREKGYKFPLAIRHLHPDAVADYDFIFYWDDDICVQDFDPIRFAGIMSVNRLDMAQPAIQSPHSISHPITGFRPSPPHWRGSAGVEVHPVVGRLTNFVEIMAPVFTREAWREFYGYLDLENLSGWGYDYIPMGRKGIVDSMPILHTRAVQSINRISHTELRQFLNSQGLFHHRHVEYGWLFE